jgi:hypothetical protein
MQGRRQIAQIGFIWGVFDADSDKNWRLDDQSWSHSDGCDR